MIQRREFITLLGGAAAAWPVAARAQRLEGKRLGVLMGYAEDDPDGQGQLSNFTKALPELGWTYGRNLRIDVRWAGTNLDRMRMFADRRRRARWAGNWLL